MNKLNYTLKKCFTSTTFFELVYMIIFAILKTSLCDVTEARIN